jgi:prepilin-type N-terminal cleavage/methylation domain-containing protein
MASSTGTQRGQHEGGFTLIELMVALVVTLLVSTSIYMLVNTAQVQFVKQPAVSSLQQNMRLAMDLITKDVLEAGDGLAPFTQAFTSNLGAKGLAGSLTGGNSDILEMVSNPRNCPPMYISTAPGGDYQNNGAEIDIMTASPAAPPTCWANAIPVGGPGALVYVFGPGGTPSPAPAPFGGASPIPGLLFATGNTSTGKQSFATAAGPGALNPGAGLTCQTGVLGTCVTMTIVQLVRYQIAPDPTDGVMSLWRSTQGLLAGPPPATPTAALGPWQLVARGIDDFQVLYDYEGGAPTPGVTAQNRNAPVVLVPPVLPMPSPPTSPAPETSFATLVRRVQITLAGYAPETVIQLNAGVPIAPGNGISQGAITWGVAGQQPALRTQLVSSVAPRAAQVTLALDTAAGHWN